MKLQTILRIVFDDHCMGANEPLECEVFGRLLREDDKCYVIGGWIPLCSEQEVVEINQETYVILKAVIKSVERLNGRKRKHS